MDLNKEVPTLFAHCKKTDLENVLKIQPGYVPLDGLCLEFFRDFSHFSEEGLWDKSFIVNI